MEPATQRSDRDVHRQLDEAMTRRRAKLGKLLHDEGARRFLRMIRSGNWPFYCNSYAKRMIRRAQALKGFYR